MKTFNKRGDRGETSLLFGPRVAKSDRRCEAYGTVDEAVSALGVARTVVRRAERRAVELKQAGMLPNEEVLRYLNRLSDLIFTLARYEDKVCLVGGPQGGTA